MFALSTPAKNGNCIVIVICLVQHNARRLQAAVGLLFNKITHFKKESIFSLYDYVLLVNYYVCTLLVPLFYYLFNWTMGVSGLKRTFR